MAQKHWYGAVRLRTILLAAFLAGAALVPLPALSQPIGVATVGYDGFASYPMFTRLVFETGNTSPERFRIGYDDFGRKVVFACMDGNIAFSFKPVDKVDGNVASIDYIQVEPGKLGVIIKLGGSALGYRVSYLYRPNRLVLDIYKQSKAKPFLPVNRQVKTIAIDPGHGGASTGLAGPGSITEAEVMFRLAQKLKEMLEAEGFTVILTRDKDTGPGPVEREGIANSGQADMYVSLHASGLNSKAGAAVYTEDEGVLDGAVGGNTPMLWSEQNAVYLPESTRLAKKLATYMKVIAGVEPPVRNVRLYGVDGLSMPAVMVEFDGIGTGGGPTTLTDNEYLDKLASIIKNGIKSYAVGG